MPQSKRIEPKDGEKEDDFIKRCMGADTMKEEYPDNDQRLAVCYSYWNHERAKGGMMKDIEIRAITSEIYSSDEDGDKTVSGLGIIYDTWAEIFPGFKEKINRGAVNLAKSVKCFFNHDPNQVLSTIDSNPPLLLNDTERGYKYVSPIPPTSYGKDLEINLERRNVKGSSFSFDVPKNGDKLWEEGGILHREVFEMTIYDIGPVVNPAYIKTTAQMRSIESIIDEWRNAQRPIQRELRKKKLALLEKG